MKFRNHWEKHFQALLRFSGVQNCDTGAGGIFCCSWAHISKFADPSEMHRDLFIFFNVRGRFIFNERGELLQE